MPLVHEARPGFAYYIPPKTASSAVVKALEFRFPGAEMLYDKHGVYAPDSWSGLYHFITVRNPFTRVISLWQFFMEFNDFSDFLRERKLHRFASKLWHCLPCHFWNDRMQRCDAVLYQETIDEDFARLPFVPPSLGLQKVNVSGQVRNTNGVVTVKDRPWHEYYGPGDEEIVLELYEQDFTRYGYEASLQQAALDPRPKKRILNP